MSKFKILLILLLVGWCAESLYAQSNVKGRVKDKRTGEPLIGASVSIKGSNNGVTTDLEGDFSIRVETFPTILVVSYIGYNIEEINVTNKAKPIVVGLSENARQLNTVEIKDSRITEKQKQAPLTIETMDAVAVKETPAANFYEGLAHLKGVDLTSASIGFKIINTRGFNSTSPVRSLQLIDGVDNQSPGLNFSLGNFLGAPELDIQRVDLIVGASGAYYGPNAFNGAINMYTKSPFLFKGISAQVKVGERNMIETSVRWAQSFKDKSGNDKWAYKFNMFYMQANDWEATNYDPTYQSLVGKTNPGGYDAVNKYGDEYTGPTFRVQPSNLTYVGIGYYLRDGYAEKDLVDYKSNNLKLTGALHYKLNKDVELIYASNFGTGTTVYQGDNRFSLRDIKFYQNRIEIRQEGKFFIRAYATNEDAGKSYDAYSAAIIMQNSVKSDKDWAAAYRNYLTVNLYNQVAGWYSANASWLNQIPASTPQDPNNRLNYINNYWYTYFLDKLTQSHQVARALANAASGPPNAGEARLLPGTPEFNAALDKIRNTSNQNGGSGFIDRSALYHIAGEYKYSYWGVDFTSGGNYRIYTPDSRGTIFYDTANTKIKNQEIGFYTGAERKLLNEKLKLSATFRLDKNQLGQKSLFDRRTDPASSYKDPIVLFSPAFTAVYTHLNKHVFRFSLSSAIRNPTLSDQFLHLDVGRAILLGNVNGIQHVATTASFIDALNNGQQYLRFFDIAPVKPEQVKTIEGGYRGSALNDKLYYDISAYYSWYTNFIGYKIAVDVIEWLPASIPNFRIIRVATNSVDEVTTKGVTVGLNYFFKKSLGFSANYSWNKLDRKGSQDSLIPAYNTPEHKYNFGVSGRDIDTKLGRIIIKHWGYSINYKYQRGFMFEGSPQFTGYVPAYGMVDAQVSKVITGWNCTLKLGASNLLDNRVYQVYGGPRVGRLAYISILFELDKWK